uniref:Uncharacterized protein n=1 Tax=Glossina palpalis gambiensis TaxID=67801 RepID=A0A1B0B135_9MUSC
MYKTTKKLNTVFNPPAPRLNWVTDVNACALTSTLVNYSHSNPPTIVTGTLHTFPLGASLAAYTELCIVDDSMVDYFLLQSSISLVVCTVQQNLFVVQCTEENITMMISLLSKPKTLISIRITIGQAATALRPGNHQTTTSNLSIPTDDNFATILAKYCILCHVIFKEGPVLLPEGQLKRIYQKYKHMIMENPIIICIIQCGFIVVSVVKLVPIIRKAMLVKGLILERNSISHRNRRRHAEVSKPRNFKTKSPILLEDSINICLNFTRYNSSSSSGNVIVHVLHPFANLNCGY